MTTEPIHIAVYRQVGNAILSVPMQLLLDAEPNEDRSDLPEDERGYWLLLPATGGAFDGQLTSYLTDKRMRVRGYFAAPRVVPEVMGRIEGDADRVAKALEAMTSVTGSDGDAGCWRVTDYQWLTADEVEITLTYTLNLRGA